MAIKRTEADRWFSNAIRLRDRHCQACGRADGKLEAAHIVGRREKILRWDALNCTTLCHTCHRYYTENPLDWVSWIRDNYGDGRIEILQEKRLGLLKDNKQTRSEVSAHYRAECRRMEATGDNNLVSWI